MTEQTTTTAQDTTATDADRAFYGSDYARFQSIIREAREADAATGDALAKVITATLAADSPEFDAQVFIASTYPVPGYARHLAKVLKSVRTGRGYVAKGDDAQGIITELAGNSAAILASIPGFDGDRFVAGTMLPVPQATDDAEGQDDDGDVDDLLS